MIKTARKQPYSLEIKLERSRLIQNTDRELARRLAEGDTQAMRELISTYGQRMYAYALRLTGDPTRAEDVMQDSLVAAWRGARRFRGSGSFIAWLLGIVHHLAMDSFRRFGLVVENELDETAISLADDPLLEDQTAVSEQRRLLRAGLRSLSPEHRAVLELVFYQGLSLQETAQVCGVPLGTVKSRLNYAKASLRGILSRAGLSAEDLE